MVKIKHLRSVFDWIQIQFEVGEFSTPKEIIEDILFLDFDLFINDKGILKYYDLWKYPYLLWLERAVLHACHVRTGFRVL